MSQTLILSALFILVLIAIIVFIIMLNNASKIYEDVHSCAEVVRPIFIRINDDFGTDFIFNANNINSIGACEKYNKDDDLFLYGIRIFFDDEGNHYNEFWYFDELQRNSIYNELNDYNVTEKA